VPSKRAFLWNFDQKKTWSQVIQYKHEIKGHSEIPNASKFWILPFGYFLIELISTKQRKEENGSKVTVLFFSWIKILANGYKSCMWTHLIFAASHSQFFCSYFLILLVCKMVILFNYSRTATCAVIHKVWSYSAHLCAHIAS
jgi:hypothetical protein